MYSVWKVEQILKVNKSKTQKGVKKTLEFIPKGDTDCKQRTLLSELIAEAKRLSNLILGHARSTESEVHGYSFL